MPANLLPRIIPPPTEHFRESIFTAIGWKVSVDDTTEDHKEKPEDTTDDCTETQESPTDDRKERLEDPTDDRKEKPEYPTDDRKAKSEDIVSPTLPFDPLHLDGTPSWTQRHESSVTLNNEPEYSSSEYSTDLEKENEKAESSQLSIVSTARTHLIILTIIIIISLTALDATILSTVTPKLVQIWGQAADIGWYGSVYLLPQPVLQPLFGKLYPYLNTKYGLLVGLALFEIGSLIAGLANGSIMFILGRAIAGVGASMITPGISLVITDIVPKDRRPILTGIAAMIGGTAACVGPIVGGVFVTHVSWRWSFFINIPFGFAAGVLFFVLYKPIPRAVRDVSWWTVICRLDPIGCSLLMSTVLTLLLAFTFAAEGGWSNAAVIALLIFSGTHLAAFVVEQMFRPPEYALLPPKILKKKVIVLCAIFGFCVEAGSTLHSYFLPTYFQGAKGKNAQASGIATLPQLLSQTIGGLIVGIVINFSGRFKPPMILGTIIFAVGSGLLLSLGVNTQPSQLIGFQILSGFGTGCCMFMALGIAQQRLERDEESIGLSMVYMVKTLGSTIAISLGSTVFNGHLYSELAADNLPPSEINNVFSLIAGTGNGHTPPVEATLQRLLAKAVTDSIDQVFLIPLIMGCMAFCVALITEQVTLVRDVPTPKPDADDGEELLPGAENVRQRHVSPVV